MKRNNKRRIILPILIIFFVIIIVACVLFLWYTLSGNYIHIAYKDTTEVDVSTTEVANSEIIINNGFVLGATNNGKWISATKFYEINGSIKDIDVDVFSENKLYGTYKTASIKRYDKTVIYTTIDKEGVPEKYLALASNENTRTIAGMTKMDATKEDEKYVKQAIGSYKLINGSVKVSEVYTANINNVSDKIICATSKKANLLGVYSAVVYVTNNTPYLVKYSYVRDTKDASRWPIYSLQFVMDLNYDNTPELILQETTGNDISYSVLELREENKFYEVLKTTIAL